MELALFTHGAYIWPVYRNFESFIAALGPHGSDVDTPASDPLYPAKEKTNTAIRFLAPALDQRLAKLHRELYDALLRPVEVFAGQRTSFAEFFWPDLLNTDVDNLMSAFIYYFVRQSARDISLADGLNVLRAVFFNHEAVEPALWLQSSVDRVAALRSKPLARKIRIVAPADTKLHDLAFVIVADSRRPSTSPGWLSGRIHRLDDGLCQVTAEFALGPSLASVMLTDDVLARLDQEVAGRLNLVFGWPRGVAA